MRRTRLRRPAPFYRPLPCSRAKSIPHKALPDVSIWAPNARGRLGSAATADNRMFGAPDQGMSCSQSMIQRVRGSLAGVVPNEKLISEQYDHSDIAMSDVLQTTPRLATARESGGIEGGKGGCEFAEDVRFARARRLLPY